MAIFDVIHERRLNHLLFLNLQEWVNLIGLIWIDVIWVSVDVIWIDAIQNYRIFAPNFFNFKIILATKVFENYVASRVFTFVFSSHCHYSLISEKYNVPISKRLNIPVFLGGMQSPLFRPNPIPVPLFRLGKLWDYASGGSRWVHTDAVILFLPKIITHFLQLPWLPKAMSQSPFPSLSM